MSKKSLWIIVVLILLLNGCVNQGDKESTEAAQQTLSPALTPTPSPTPPIEPTQEPTPTPTLADKFSPMPTPEKITMQIDGKVKAAIIELLAKFPTTVSDEETYKTILSPLWHFGESTIIPRSFKLFDLENDGTPEIVMEIGYWEGGCAVIYKYMDGQYKQIGSTDGGYSFFNDDKGRLVLYECGEAYSNGTKYSYIDISAYKMIKDTVYSIGAWNVEDFNYMDNIEHDFMETLYNPSALDKSVKQIAEIDSSAIHDEAQRMVTEQLTKSKNDNKILMNVKGEIVDRDILVIESDGIFYTPAQSILDFFGVTFDFNKLTSELTFTRDDRIIDEFDLIKFQKIYSGHVENMEAPPKMIDGTLMLPLKFISYAYSSAWIPEFNMVYIIY